MSEDWLGLGAAALGQRIDDGNLDPRALSEAYLAAIAGHAQAGQIYARLTPERARAEAAAAAGRAAAGKRLGPLDGVPLSWKDLVDSAGVATESGSSLLEGRVPDADADVLQAATLRGLVCLGKTHQTELAFSGLGLNPATATPPNIHDPALLPGGSSSGAAASVAFGLAPAAVGSDTGGSVRLPAAWNDLVGLKTTHGLLSLTGVVPLCPGFDTIGPLTRSVADAALLLEALGGGAAPDLRGASLAGARLMVLETVVFDGIEPAPAAAFEAAVSRLAAAGARIERRALPWLAEAQALNGPLFSAEAWASWGALIETAPEKLHPPVLARFRSGAGVLASDYLRARAALAFCRARWLAETAGFDAVLIPTVPILPPLREAVAADPALFTERNLLALRNTRVANALGLCALTLPTGERHCGISLMGPAMADKRILRLGAAAEAALA